MWGGLLLLWICWKLWSDLRNPETVLAEMPDQHELDGSVKHENPPMASAIFQIVMADVSMSLDNVLAVAGIADGHQWLLVGGLALSVLFMTIAAAVIANTLQKHRWIGYVGLAIILYVAAEMIYKGYGQLMGT